MSIECNLITMDAKNPLLHAFQKPTMENVRILEDHVNKDAIGICAKGQDKLIITAIFTMIAELPDIRYAKLFTTNQSQGKFPILFFSLEMFLFTEIEMKL